MVTIDRQRATVLDRPAVGEGPRWEDGALYLADMPRDQVLRVDKAGTAKTIAQHSSAVSGIGWLPDGTLLVVAMEGEILRLGPAGLSRHADLSVQAAHGGNDMIVHPGGG